MARLLKKTLFGMLCSFICAGIHAQIEHTNTKAKSVATVAKDDITCFYIVDRVYTDPRNPDKRTVVGGVNFFQVEEGKISVGARTPKTSFFFNGTVDSLETVLVDGVSVIRVFATNSFNSPTIYPYVFEISQAVDGPVTISARRMRSTSFLYFFDVHKASAQEITETRANASK